MAPRDLERLQKSGTIAPSLLPLVPIAEMESAELIDALGGSDAITPQQRILIEDAVAVGMTLRGTLALYLQKNDPELGSRISGMATTRRGIMQALGLQRAQREVASWESYLKDKGPQKSKSGATDAITVESQSVPDEGGNDD